MTGLLCLLEMDLLFGWLGMVLFSLFIFLLGYQFGAKKSHKKLMAIILSLLGLGILWGVFVQNQPFLCQVLPFRNLIILGNWTCIFSSLIAGLAMNGSKGSLGRRAIAPGILFLIGIASLLQPLWGIPPQLGAPHLNNGIVRQTSEWSCSPACAATLLHQHGIQTSEAEMVELCLSRKGTAWQGLYRGLKIKTASTSYRVSLFQCDFEELKTMTPGWLILTVGLPRWGEFDPIYEEQYGWRRGDLHSVILRDFNKPGCVLIVDPDVGQEEWSEDDLRLLYRGFGFRLIEAE